MSGVNPFPSRFKNRTACFLQNVSLILLWVSYVTVKKYYWMKSHSEARPSTIFTYIKAWLKISCYVYSRKGFESRLEVTRGLFLEIPGNFSGPKARSQVPSPQTVSLASFFVNWWFRCIVFKIIEISILNENMANVKQLSEPEKLPGLSRNWPQDRSRLLNGSLGVKMQWFHWISPV